MDLEPGDRVGEYVVLRDLGQGAMGSVFLAQGPGGRRVALKLMGMVGGQALARFMREHDVGA